MRTLEQVTVVSDQDRQFLHEVKRTIQKFLPTAEVLLYGSIARGTQSSESDYDILVLTSRALSAAEEDVVYKALFQLELSTGAVVSTIFCSKQQWETPLYRAMPFHWEVDRDAIVI